MTHDTNLRSSDFLSSSLTPRGRRRALLEQVWRRYSRKISRSEFCRSTIERREHSLRSPRDDGTGTLQLASSRLGFSAIAPPPIPASRSGLDSDASCLTSFSREGVEHFFVPPKGVLGGSGQTSDIGIQSRCSVRMNHEAHSGSRFREALV